MRTFFWALLFNATLGIILSMIALLTELNISFLSTLIFYGLILKGIWSLNKSETHFRTVIVLSVIIMVGALIQFLGGFINNVYLNSVVAWFAMISSISGIFAEYNLIKGIQSYKPVLSQPKETDKMMKYWKIAMVASLVAVVLVFISLIAFVIVLVISYGSESMPNITTEAEALDLIMQVVRANGVFSVVLLIGFIAAYMTVITCRILMIVSMNTISKDHRQFLANPVQTEPVIQ
mgnify:CR=1 FL=1